MKILIPVALVVLAIVLLRMLLSSRRRGGSRVPAPKKPGANRPASGASSVRSDYRAVSVECGPEACEQALALSGRRFLIGRFEQLPLPECTSSGCSCKFVHHRDRRDSDGDQRAPTALRSDLYIASGKPERRSRRGRRKDDFG